MNACILVKVIPTKIVDVVGKVQKVKGVRKAYMAYGRFDVVAFAEAESYSDIKAISAIINKLEGVRSTETLPEA